MNNEEFREELKKLDVNDLNWKEKMLMVSKLYKSLGFGLKEIASSDDALINNVYFYIGNLVERNINPTVEDFYAHVLIQRELKDLNKLRAKLTNEEIKKLFYGDSKNIDINDEEKFVETKFSQISKKVAKDLISNSDFFASLYKYIILNHDMSSKKEFIETMTETDNGALDYIFEFITGDEKANQAFQNMFVLELQKYEKNMRMDIRNGLINRIISITNFFKQCGYFEEAMEINNSIMKKLNLPMQVAMEEKKADFNIENLTSEKYFAQFSNEELFVFSAFYCNRFEKIVENLHDGIYLHMKLGTFYDTVAYDEIPRNISKNDANVVLKQKQFLEYLTRDEFKNLKDSVNEETEKIDFTYVPEEYIKTYKKVYEEYFGRYIRAENNFETDYRFMFLNRGVSYCMYVLKDFSIESLLYTLLQNSSKINFGLIPENRRLKNEYGEKQVCVGVDYKEFPTMRLHYPEKDFNEFASRILPNEKFPSYIGNEDFVINGTDITTQFLYKFTKRQKQLIKKEMETEKKKNPNSDRYKFLRHMYENIHPNQNPLNSKKKNDLDEI